MKLKGSKWIEFPRGFLLTVVVLYILDIIFHWTGFGESVAGIVISSGVNIVVFLLVIEFAYNIFKKDE